jgi:hypothetical protein
MHEALDNAVLTPLALEGHFGIASGLRNRYSIVTL